MIIENIQLTPSDLREFHIFIQKNKSADSKKNKVENSLFNDRMLVNFVFNCLLFFPRPLFFL